MSKLKERLMKELDTIEESSVPAAEQAEEIEDSLEDILMQLEYIAQKKLLNFNIAKKVRKIESELRKLGMEVVKDIKSNK